jgi:hypothetical protein
MSSSDRIITSQPLSFALQPRGTLEVGNICGGENTMPYREPSGAGARMKDRSKDLIPSVGTEDGDITREISKIVGDYGWSVR